jgi:hypothetical protein
MLNDSPLRRHVDLVGLLFIVGGLLTLLVGVSLISLAAGAASLLMAGDRSAPGVAAALTTGALGGVALLVLAWGTIHFLTGRALRRHRPWARQVSLGMSVLDLFVPPLGTALGIYALWVLLNDQARQLFEPSGA